MSWTSKWLNTTGWMAGVVLAAASLLTAAEKNPQVDVFLSFDTEDYLLPASDDAAKRLAEMLSDRGIRATFRVVGEKARVLDRRNRKDVIAALKQHDIGYHTNLHSVHPTPAEYLSRCGLLDGVEEFIRREREGVQDIRRVFGIEKLSCYCQPGSSWACQSIIALDRIGVGPVAAEIGMHIGLDDKPYWAYGVLNIYEMGINYTDVALYDPDALEPARVKASEMVQRLRGEGGGLISIGYHPCDWVHRQFWDATNFRYGANPPREQWKVPPQRSAEETEQAFTQFAAYIDHLRSLNARFVTASELPAIYADLLRTEGISEEGLLELAMMLSDDKAAGVDYRMIEGKSISPADQFELFTTAVDELTRQTSLSLPLQAKGILGPDSPPGEMTLSGQSVPWAALRDATRDVRNYLTLTRRVPPRVFIGAEYVSPVDFLAGLASVVRYRAEHGQVPTEVKLGSNLAVLTERHVADVPVTPFTWSIHKRDLDISGIQQVARLQAWTIKPAVRQ